MTLAEIETTTPALRWGNQAHRTHRGTGGGRVPRLWTQEACLEALRNYVTTTKGKLPVNNAYNAVSKGRNLPTQQRVLEYFGSMNTAWLAAGASRRRVGLLKWEPHENDFLRDNAGLITRKDLARKLGRSEGAVKRQLYKLGIRCRDNQGYVSADAIARQYGCAVSRVYKLIEDGVIEARKPSKVSNRWEIAPWLISQEAKDQLRRSKRRNFKPYTHGEINTIIALREEGRTWHEVGRLLQRNYAAVSRRYEMAFLRRPLWRALWYLAQEFGGSVALVTAADVLNRRGHRTRYGKLRTAAAAQPDRLRLSGGVVSVVTHWSQRIRPHQAERLKNTHQNGRRALAAAPEDLRHHPVLSSKDVPNG